MNGLRGREEIDVFGRKWLLGTEGRHVASHARGSLSAAIAKWALRCVSWETIPSLSAWTVLKGLVVMISIDAEDHHIVTLRTKSLLCRA